MLEEVFPMVFNSPDWQDSEKLHYCAISPWEYWLHTKDEEHFLENVSCAEQFRRDTLFRELHKKIIDNLHIYNVKMHKNKLKVKETRCKEELYWRLDPKYSKSGHLLLLPEIEAVYYNSTDDTSIMYYQNRELLGSFDKWVEEAGLKYVQ